MPLWLGRALLHLGDHRHVREKRDKWYRHKGAYVMRTGLYVMCCGWLFLGGHALPELLLAQLQTWASRLPS